MTASSVKLFPCRVQPMGLLRSTTTSSGPNNLNELNTAINRRPPMHKRQEVSRNLFGAPDPVEMSNLFKQENERNLSYLNERYNINTRSPIYDYRDREQENKTDLHNNIENASSSLNKPTTMPTLIEQELKQHEQKLRCEEQRVCRTAPEVTPPNMKIIDHANCSPNARRRCLHSGIDRQKPYTRQSLLTGMVRTLTHLYTPMHFIHTYM